MFTLTTWRRSGQCAAGARLAPSELSKRAKPRFSAQVTRAFARPLGWAWWCGAVIGALSCAVDDRALSASQPIDGGDNADGGLSAKPHIIDASLLNDAARQEVSDAGVHPPEDAGLANDAADPRCGDGRTDPGEECDDGNVTEGDGCEPSCQFSCAISDPARACQSSDVCRPDGACDPVKHICALATAKPDGTACTSPAGGTLCRGGTCAMPGCGNGQVGLGEECDDGNTVNGDGCQNDCRYTCDESDPSRNCALSNPCQASSCTSSHKCSVAAPLTDGLSCGTDVNRAYCRAGACVRAVCGNGQLETALGEECDDGNQVDGDGCDKSCRYSCVSSESARDCKPNDPCDGASTCNDATHRCSVRTKVAEGAPCGSGTPASVCHAGLCTPANCGNRLVELGEECDDGNAIKADGCEPNCKWTCTSNDPSRNCSTSNLCDGASTCSDQHLCTTRKPLAEGATCGTAAMPAFCRSGACSSARCGNGFVEPGENCDDKNTLNGDGCENNCIWSCPQGGTRACAGAKGNCAKGTQTCTDGKWSTCSVTPKSPDSCTVLGDDADCDGTPNENCACVEGQPDRACGHAAVGVCRPGTQHCKAGQWQACTGNIESRARDCTSAADNDCNGLADNAESTFCACAVGSSRACQAHPGKDGVGICKPGSQACAASSDKTTSSWSVNCVGSVGPSPEVCNADLKDEDCNNLVNDGCDCINGPTAPCGTCGGTTTCVNGKLGSSCSKSASTYYRDSDGDGYGDPNVPTQACTPPSGFVDNNRDCCDADDQALPGNTGFYTRETRCGGYDFNCDGIQTPEHAPRTCSTPIQCGLVDGVCQQTGGCDGECNGRCGNIIFNGCGSPWGVTSSQCVPAGPTCTAVNSGAGPGNMGCH